MVSSEPLPKTGTHSGTKPRKNRYSSQNTEKPTMNEPYSRSVKYRISSVTNGKIRKSIRSGSQINCGSRA